MKRDGASEFRPGFPAKQGLYDPQFEKDSCGIGFVADIKGRRSHDIIQKGLQVLENLSHRGAVGCDPCTGDGAGILIQVPHAFSKRACGEIGITPCRNRDSTGSAWSSCPLLHRSPRLRDAL
ncbi:MAG: hypothetical protein MPW15_19260 [Candidatus Manganitrophus sp.]|nr:hypothetical protein [Candidatus Manganitrophus sp.]